MAQFRLIQPLRIGRIQSLTQSAIGRNPLPDRSDKALFMTDPTSVRTGRTQLLIVSNLVPTCLIPLTRPVGHTVLTSLGICTLCVVLNDLAPDLFSVTHGCYKQNNLNPIFNYYNWCVACAQPLIALRGTAC